jgi:5-methylcytosine-specific restriction endonuclease McrA
MINEEYEKYLKSDHWQKKRLQILDFWDHRCCICNSSENLEVHHRTYERVGNELITDCIVLCDKCHERNKIQNKFEDINLYWLEKSMRVCNGWI